MRKLLYAIILSVITLSCTSNFDEIDTNKAGFIGDGDGVDKSPAISYLSQAQRLIYPDNSGPYPIAAWVLQVQSNLNVDIWAGYLASGTIFIGGYNNQSYDLVDNWNAYMLDYWSLTMGQINSMTKAYDLITEKKTYDHTTMAMGVLTKVLASERAADMYGTLPYTSTGSEPKYNSLEDIYNRFFEEIDYAQELLEKGESLITDGENDQFYKGDKLKWLRLSNTLRLRLAMRIVKVSPSVAKAQAEKALSNGYGLIADNTDNCGFTSNLINGLCVLAQAWGDTRMSADMESILVGYNDPRLPKYFSKNGDHYKGVRIGSVFEKNSGAEYSSLGSAFPLDATYEKSPIFLVNAAEAYFLRAEAALRGFAGAGDVKENYSKGIEMSMRQYGITDQSTINAYLNSTNKPIDWVSSNQAVATSKPAACKISPNFEEALDKEVKLEKIITQKWIAMFPGGSTVAWSEYRRTGYPRLIPAYQSYVAPQVVVSYGPKIVNNAKKAAIPQAQYNLNLDNVTEAVNQFFNGKDKIYTPVWWDVDVANI